MYSLNIQNAFQITKITDGTFLKQFHCFQQTLQGSNQQSVSDSLIANSNPVLNYLHFTCLFAGHFKQFFVKFRNWNFPSARMFLFRKTTKFPFTLQPQQLAQIILQKMLDYVPQSCIWIAFWSQTPNEGAYTAPSYLPAVGTTPYIFADHF